MDWTDGTGGGWQICFPDRPGCINPDAVNFSPYATEDDGSCTLCRDGSAAALADDGSRACLVNGCTNPTAANYGPGANADDGSCVEGTLFCGDEADWPDLDHDLVCGACQVLVNHFDSRYGSCNGYCASIGRTCTNAWEERDDDCVVLYGLTCGQELGTSDALCECGGRR